MPRLWPFPKASPHCRATDQFWAVVIPLAVVFSRRLALKVEQDDAGTVLGTGVGEGRSPGSAGITKLKDSTYWALGANSFGGNFFGGGREPQQPAGIGAVEPSGDPLTAWA